MIHPTISPISPSCPVYNGDSSKVSYEFCGISVFESCCERREFLRFTSPFGPLLGRGSLYLSLHLLHVRLLHHRLNLDLT